MKTLIQKLLTLVGGIVLVLLLIVFLSIGPLPWNNTSASFADIDEHFRYGSIGGESTNGLPYWVWKVLPTMFADKLPGEGYQSLGFMQEPGRDLPIGFAKSKVNGLEVVTQNCATCHVGQVRTSPNSKPLFVSTMPSHNVDLGGYIQFLRDVAVDPHFNAQEMMPYIEASGANLNPLEKLLYRFVAIPQTKDALMIQGNRLSFMDRQSPYGPGRVDTFTPYKTLRFNFPKDKLADSELQGISDYPPVWKQRARDGMQLHWDGNNDSVDERNKSAALALVQPTTINFASIHRVRDWLFDVPPPKYPFPIDAELATQGKTLYENSCASCHAFGGTKTGTIEPIAEIGTDRGRLDSYTPELAANQYALFAGITYQGEDQRFTHFRKTDGYANLPLDGVWLRAPYLHNGSVPTLWDLLQKPSDRPTTFYRGNDLYVPDKVGFATDVAAENGKRYFPYDTRLPSNGNGGHLYGTELSAADKKALLEYLKGI
ncbi:c-type cytochrome [Altericista sp. CCNU0014]|uniref:c-type cytochrome n=1 Tax=Altericista sp. CCNU0014 TaxID=3082949 RepID=UPI0038514DC2